MIRLLLPWGSAWQWTQDLPDVTIAPTGTSTASVGGLASTNFNMAFDGTGNYLYVVGTEARDEITGNGNLLEEDATRTGEVEGGP